MTQRPILQAPLLATALGLALSAVPAVATAHVELTASTPEPGANLDSPPSEVVLTFDGELDPTGSGFTVLDHHGEEVGRGEVDLEVADRNVVSGAVTIDEPGVYTVEWSVLGADGHEITGSFSFGYATDEEIPEGEGEGHGHENPDTALPGADARPVLLIGLAMVALAGLAAVRRAVVR